MHPLKKLAKNYIPAKIISFVLGVSNRLRRLFVYSQYDSSAYWRKRATDPGQAAVLWQNQEYNLLYRKDQEKIIAPYFIGLASGTRVLDIGCGIGVVANMLIGINNRITVDAVDFPEMIVVACSINQHQNIRYISSSAEDYYAGSEQYEIILSSGCYSAIRDIAKLEKSFDNAAAMLMKGGMLILIDPFHRWKYLARAKYNSRDVINYLSAKNLNLIDKSGVLFWPFRDWLANSNYSGAALSKRYQIGERLLKSLGRHFWADYKILIFAKE